MVQAYIFSLWLNQIELVNMTLIRIDKTQCKGSSCHLCINVCPVHILVPSKTPSLHGGVIPKVTDPDACTLCRKCEVTCPDFAISVLKNEQ